MSAPKEDPWLVNPCNYYTVDQGGASSYRYNITFFDALRKALLIDIVVTEDDATDVGRSGTMRASLEQENQNPKQSHQRWTRQLTTNKHFIILLIVIFVVLPIGHLILGSVLLFKRDGLMRALNIAIGKHYKSKCIDEVELTNNGRHLRQKLEETETRIRDFGVCPTITSVSVMYHAVLSSGAIIFYLISTIVLFSKPLIVDHIVYLINPCAERKRTAGKLKCIAHTLANSLATLMEQYSSLISVRRPMKKDTLAQCEQSEEDIDISPEILVTLVDINNRIRRKLNALLNSLLVRQLVRPFSYSPQWHADYIAFARYTILRMLPPSIGINTVFVSAIICIELYSRTSARLDSIECQTRSFEANRTLLLTRHVFLPYINSTEDIDTYMNSSKSEDLIGGNFIEQLIARLPLMFTIEIKYYFKPQAIIFLISFHLVAVALVIGAIFYAFVYVTGMLSKLAWIEQIIQQVKYCIELKKGSISQRSYHCGPADPIGNLLFRKRSQTDTINNFNKHFIQLTLITMINFELFRRNHKPFTRTANLLALQMCIFCGSGLIFCYAVLNYSVDELKKYNLVNITSLAFALNIYVGYSSYLTSRAEKLMRSIGQLVALFPAQTFHVSEAKKLDFDEQILIMLTMTFWRRYLISESETRKLLAPNLFGAPLNFPRLVSLDAYAIALCLFLWKPVTS